MNNPKCMENNVNTGKEIVKTDRDFGVYGRKDTFSDAKVTVTEFLDDLYDDCENYNESFLSFERRLQEYFGYEKRDTENGQAEADAGKVDDDELLLRKAKAHYMAAIRCLIPDMNTDAVECAEKGFDAFKRDIMVDIVLK